MNARMRENHWQMTARRRRKPGAGDQLVITCDDGVGLTPDPNQPPCEIVLEATDATGEPSPWLDDHFWVGLLQAWSKAALIVRIQPTFNALVHPVVLHQLHMLRRVATNWRLVGDCYVADLGVEGRIAEAALSPYHELRIIDGPRSGQTRTAHALRIEDALARIRRVQVANTRNTPIVVCVRPEAPGSERAAASVPSRASAVRTG